MEEIEIIKKKLKNIVEQGAYTEEEKIFFEEGIWSLLRKFQKKKFQTVKGFPFIYEIKGNEMFIDRKEKSITKASVVRAFENLVQQGGKIQGPKKLGTFGASYLYPIFIKLELIKEKERQEEHELE